MEQGTLYFASFFSANTLVMAAESVVLPWSTCPIVPEKCKIAVCVPTQFHDLVTASLTDVHVRLVSLVDFLATGSRVYT